MKQQTMGGSVFSQPFLRRMLLKEGSIVVIVALSSLSGLLAMAVPVLTGKFIDSIGVPGAAVGALMVLLVVLCTLFCTEVSGRWYASWKSRRLKLRLQKALAEEFAAINPGRMGEFMPGELAAKFIRDAEVVSGIVQDIVPMATLAAVGIACSLGISFGRSMLIGTMMVLLAAACAMVLLRFSRGIAVANRNNRMAMDGCMSMLVEMIANFPWMKAMSAVSSALSWMEGPIERANSAEWNLNKENLKFESTVKGMMFLGEVMVLSIAGLMAVRGIITVGDVIVFQMLFAQTLGSISSTFRLMPMLGYVNEAVAAIGELVYFDGKEHDCGKPKVNTFKGRVELRNAFFAYGAGMAPVLDGMSFTLGEKECCVLVGANGSGKTTLAKLVGAFSEPGNGVVLYDGVDVREIDRESLRRKISFVFQDPMVFSGTIRDNITLGGDFPEEDLLEVLDVCGLRDFISSHAEGLSYRIASDNGLSGGERQRIAAARALIRKPALLVFDEPSNHIDSRGFEDLQKIIAHAKNHSSILLITHDERLVAIADRVVSMDNTERNKQ